jgi:hypothetical protein
MEQQAKEQANHPAKNGVGLRRLKPLPGTKGAKARKQVSPESVPTGDDDKLRAPAELVPEKVASLSSVQEHTTRKQVSITNQSSEGGLSSLLVPLCDAPTQVPTVQPKAKQDTPKPRSKLEKTKPEFLELHWPTDEQQQEFEMRTCNEDVPSKEGGGGVCQSPAKALLSVKLPFKKSKFKSTHILQLPAVPDNTANVHLVRYFVDKVWKLPRPEVIISVTGGAKHFDLSPEHKDRMMRGMMEGTRKLNPWSLSTLSLSLSLSLSELSLSLFLSSNDRERERACGNPSCGLASFCLPFQVSVYER